MTSSVLIQEDPFHWDSLCAGAFVWTEFTVQPTIQNSLEQHSSGTELQKKIAADRNIHWLNSWGIQLNCNVWLGNLKAHASSAPLRLSTTSGISRSFVWLLELAGTLEQQRSWAYSKPLWVTAGSLWTLPAWLDWYSCWIMNSRGQISVCAALSLMVQAR